MISRKQKELFYLLSGPLMKLNGLVYKIFKAPISNNKSIVKVQLGPGQNNYIDGWINVDANIFSGKADVWANLNNQLPFNNDSVDIFYSHHVIEHLFNLKSHFKQMHNALKPNGRIRIGGPNADSAIKKYIANDTTWFNDFPDERKSIGGKLENFIICRQEHLTLLTFSFLEELLLDAGFKNIKSVISSKETNFNDIILNDVLSKEWELDFNFPITLMIEAEKK